MGIKFFRKNRIDLDRLGVTLSVTDSVASSKGESSLNFLRNRDNTSGWMTTGSSDVAGTTLEIDMTERQDFDHIIMTNINFKSYTLKYWDGDDWADFSTPIAPTTNTKTTVAHSFDLVSSSKVQLVINGTQTPDDDKRMSQLIITDLLGELECEPEIRPVFDRSRKVTRFLSGKSFIARNAQVFMVDIRKNNVISDNDLSLLEKLFASYEGFLVWLCGGDDSQYPTERLGFRLQDIFLMNCRNDYEPAWEDGHYTHGIPIDLRLVEVI